LIEAAITPRTKAIICVHQLGMPCDLHRVVTIAARHSIPVIEDAACATGSEILWKGRWEKIGKPHGDIACFSFHPRKVITTGDGGMLTTANPEYDRKFRLWRQHGMSVTDSVRHGSKRVIFESYPELGYNYRMTDMQAAVGREQLKRLPTIIALRRELADQYGQGLRSTASVMLPIEPAWARSNWQSFCLRLAADLDQRDVMQELLDRGVSTRRGIMNIHLEGAYCEPGSHGVSVSLRRSVEAQQHSIILPLFAQMETSDLIWVVDAVKSTVHRHQLAIEQAVG